MSTRRLAWGVWAVAIALVPGTVLQVAINWVGPSDIPFGLGFVGVSVCSATAGAVVASRQPRHAVGWIFLALGAGIGLAVAPGAYGDLAFNTSYGPLPGQEAAAWLSSWAFIPIFFGLPMFLLLLFPNGRFLTARWKRAGQLIGGILALAIVSTAFKPGPLEGAIEIENPLGAGGALGDAMEVLEVASQVAALPGFALAVASLAIRYRRSRGVERQQLRWFTYAAALVGTGFVGSMAFPVGWAADALFLIGLLALCGLPIAAGVAILRYRLYDLDLVIRRTLVYGALSAALAASYLGLVLLLQLVLSPGSDLAIAGSTLAVAALFRPLRSRIQALVDLRFYRSRYDAEHTLEGFGARLRDEVDLEALGGELRGVVAQTMQPAHVSLWLREEAR